MYFAVSGRGNSDARMFDGRWPSNGFTVDEISSTFRVLLSPHYKAPCNCYPMQHPTHQMTCHNAFCGDKITVFVKTCLNSKVEEISFLADACSIVIASASIMTLAMKGETQKSSLRKADTFLEHCSIFLRGEQPQVPELTGELFELTKIRQLPARAKCARLPWFALKQALEAS